MARPNIDHRAVASDGDFGMITGRRRCVEQASYPHVRLLVTGETVDDTLPERIVEQLMLRFSPEHGPDRRRGAGPVAPNRASGFYGCRRCGQSSTVSEFSA